MKKFLPLLVVGILIISGVGAIGESENQNKNVISEAIVFSQPNIVEEDNYLSIELIESTSYLMEEEKPLIPIITKVYTFPLGTCINDVKVSFSKQIEKWIDKLVISSPEIHIFSTAYALKNDKKQKKEVDYSDVVIYPESKFNYRTATGLKDGERVLFLTLSIHPVQYIPQENLILYSKDATVDISYELPVNPITFPDVYDLLIITHRQFKSALQRLVDYKNNLDPPIRTIMTSLDDIPSGVGFDVQEDIKYYVKDAIENWGIQYLCIVGAGVNGSELFPFRKALIPSQPHETWFPSDLYYADIFNDTMGFSDWDYDEDGVFAEYSLDLYDMDLLPDVGLGRIACNNVQELEIYIDKIIKYKNHNKMVNKILSIGGDTVTGTETMEGEYQNEAVLEKLPGYESIRAWASNGKLTKANIRNGFRSAVDFVDFAGHGSPWSWATHPEAIEAQWIPAKTLISPWTGFRFNDINIYNLNNANKFPVIVFTACSNNKFTATKDVIGWRMICKEGGGGIATFAEAGIGSGPGGERCVDEGVGLIEICIFEELYKSKIIGKAWGDAIVSYYNKRGPSFAMTDYKTMIEFCLIGDPTIAAEDGIDPRIRSANNPTFGGYIARLIEQFPILAKLFEIIIATIS